MAAIAARRERRALAAGVGVPAVWGAVAEHVRDFAAARGLALRDLIVLLPYAALIPPARDAFVSAGGWQPRIETPQTLAAALGPPPAESGGLSGDVITDRLQAEQLLRRALAAAAGIDRAHAAALVVDAAQALAREAAQRTPQERAALWRDARQAIEPSARAIGAADAALLALAVAWASDAAVPPATDRLYAAAPAAWVVVRVGGADALAERVLDAAAAPGLLIDLDLRIDETDVGPETPPSSQWRRWVADDLEDEAMAAASAVIEALTAGAQRVAVVALDRVLTRRIVALLARRGIAADDETGWRLSTTPAAARLLARLRAMPATAGRDGVLDWLKSWPLARRHGSGVDALEARWRGRRRDIGSASSADALWRDAQACREPWQSAVEQPLADWLALLLRQLDAESPHAEPENSPDAQQLLQRLRQLHEDPAVAAASASPVSLGGFTRWVESVCEAANVQPLARGSTPVVVAPLSRVIARPFDHVVLAGADERRLGPFDPAPALIGEGLAQRLGLATAAQARARQRLALAQLARVPQVTVTWRRVDGDEPLAPSPDLEALAAWARHAGWSWAAPCPWPARRAAVPVVRQERPEPIAPKSLPDHLSASAIEALRACPYRFFARSLLHLDEAEELDVVAGKREYGNWLHAALHRFHLQRSGSDDAGELHAAADAAIDELKLDRSELLPFRASVEAFVPAYLRWLAAREAQGWRWQAGEEELSARPPGWAPQALRGRVDRIDRHRDGGWQVIDYKTGSAERLQQRLSKPLEETQLAFYAALLRDRDEAASITAAYLALDDRRGPRMLEHKSLDRSATVLVAELGAELQRIRDGAALPALGEGEVCLTCEARGLCRRDHWPDAAGDTGPEGSTQ